MSDDDKKNKDAKKIDWFIVLKQLRAIREYPGMLKTPMGQYLRRNHTQLDNYTKFLVKALYIVITLRISDRKELLHVTAEGKKMFENFKEQFEIWVKQEEKKQADKKQKEKDAGAETGEE